MPTKGRSYEDYNSDEMWGPGSSGNRGRDLSIASRPESTRQTMMDKGVAPKTQNSKGSTKGEFGKPKKIGKSGND